jgi:hypothetical protein
LSCVFSASPCLRASVSSTVRRHCGFIAHQVCRTDQRCFIHPRKSWFDSPTGVSNIQQKNGTTPAPEVKQLQPFPAIFQPCARLIFQPCFFAPAGRQAHSRGWSPDAVCRDRTPGKSPTHQAPNGAQAPCHARDDERTWPHKSRARRPGISASNKQRCSPFYE